MTARRLRPISRWISWVRPLCRPRVASRSVRVAVERGSMPYSAVTQPFPVLRRNGGTRSSTEAVHSTWVSPNFARHEPSAYFATPGSRVIGRIASGARPEGRMLLSAVGHRNVVGRSYRTSRRSGPVPVPQLNRFPWSTGRNWQKPDQGPFPDRTDGAKSLRIRQSKGKFPKRPNRELNPPNRDGKPPNREGPGKRPRLEFAAASHSDQHLASGSRPTSYSAGTASVWEA